MIEWGRSNTTPAGRARLQAVGTHEIHTEHPSFRSDRSEVRTGLRLRVGQEAVVNLTLQIGTIAQEIVVPAEAPLRTAGRITSTSSTSRQVQFALKLIY